MPRSENQQSADLPCGDCRKHYHGASDDGHQCRSASDGPYIPAFFKTNSLFASDVNLAIHPDAHIILAPNIGSYVGGDITAGALVSMIWNGRR